jgi:hypothetical protein
MWHWLQCPQLRKEEFAVRRLLLVALASAMALSACGQGKGWPAISPVGTQGPSQAASASLTASADATATPTPTAEPTPTQALPTKAPTPTVASGLDADWITLAPSGFGFTSKWPGTPTKKTTTSATSAGDSVTVLWSYQDGVDLAYFAAVVTYPTGSLTGKTAASIYDFAVTSMTTSTANEMTITNQGSVTVNGHSGRSFSLAGSAFSIEGAMALVGNNLYIAYVAYTSAVTDMSSPETFFNDFTLTV